MKACQHFVIFQTESYLHTSGIVKASLKLRLAATIQTGSKHPNIAPNKIIFPDRGSTGILAKWYPKGNRFSSLSRAC